MADAKGCVGSVRQRRRQGKASGEKEVWYYALVLCSALAVIARRREFVVGAEAYSTSCEVALDRACAGDDDDVCALTLSNGGLEDPLEAVCHGVCVVLPCDRYVVLEQLATRDEWQRSGRNDTARAIGKPPFGLTVSMDLLLGVIGPGEG